VELLTAVENAFEGRTRGCWIAPHPWESTLRIRAKQKIQLRSPDGTTLNTYIGSIERAHGPCVRVRLTIGLPAKKDIPEGTEIWLLEQEIT